MCIMYMCIMYMYMYVTYNVATGIMVLPNGAYISICTRFNVYFICIDIIIVYQDWRICSGKIMYIYNPKCS